MSGPGSPEARDPALVPVSVVTADDGIEAFAADLRGATRLAIDTETVYRPGDGGGPGALRVVSAALRRPGGQDVAWVLDVRGLAAAALAAALDGAEADGWNASFDAHVLDRDVFRPAGLGRSRGVRWWDAQFADALLHAGQRSWYHGLAWASEHYLGVVAAGKGTTQLSYDAESDLSAAQVAYAAADAVETLWVGDVLRRRLADQGLIGVADLEMAARPFLAELERRGAPFDRAACAEGVAGARAAMAAARTLLAELTGGGQGNLFSPDLEPTWDLDSRHEVRAALNRWAPCQVEAALARREGRPRLLGPEDHVDAGLLAEVGGPLGEALLAHRDEQALVVAAKRLLDQASDDGRVRSRYLQVVGSPNGSPTSRAPDLAALPPALRAHVRPPEGRAFVEVRLVHAPPGPPGPGGRGEPVEGSLVEALGADPRVAAGAGALVPAPGEVPDRLPPIDWSRTLRLYDELGPLRAFRRAFRDEHRRWPSRAEVRAARPALAAWVLGHEDAVVLDADGAPLRWSVRSPAGRQRWFSVRTGDLIRAVVEAVAASADEDLARIWRAGAGDDPLPLIGAGPPRGELSPLGAARRRDLVAALWSWSSARATTLFEDAVLAAVAGLGPAQARAPIEMALADAALAAAAGVWELLARPDADGDGLEPVALLDDALVLECADSSVPRWSGELRRVAETAVPGVVGGLPLAVRVSSRPSLGAREPG
ncbi:MAG: hypothetical protein GEV08_16130 [Acidimicrobiia bacterium]|nr:hypothetical protein [Acidimicrobiia bacterium]